MKVLLVSTEKLPVPPVKGGAIQTYIAAVSPILAQRHEVTVLGTSDPSLPDQERIGGIEYVRVPGGTLHHYTGGVLNFLEGKHFDLIQIYNRPRLVPMVKRAYPQARLFLSMHNDMFMPSKITADEASDAVAALEGIITVSDYVGRGIVSLYPEAEPKLRTVYSGVDLQRFVPPVSREALKVRQEIRSAHGLEGRAAVLFVGRLSPKKGADVLLRAMSQVASKNPQTALVLVGSKWYGEDRLSDYVSYVKAMAARSPIPVVTTGYVPPDRVHEWFWAGDLFVCSSLWQEPLARVHYEAMAAGLPIVTTRRGGNPEVIDGVGAGIVVDDPESAADMAEAIVSLLGDRSRREQMGRRGREMAVAHYGWDRVASDLLRIWE